MSTLPQTYAMQSNFSEHKAVRTIAQIVTSQISNISHKQIEIFSTNGNESGGAQYYKLNAMFKIGYMKIPRRARGSCKR